MAGKKLPDQTKKHTTITAKKPVAKRATTMQEKAALLYSGTGKKKPAGKK